MAKKKEPPFTPDLAREEIETFINSDDGDLGNLISKLSKMRGRSDSLGPLVWWADLARCRNAKKWLAFTEDHLESCTSTQLQVLMFLFTNNAFKDWPWNSMQDNRLWLSSLAQFFSKYPASIVDVEIDNPELIQWLSDMFNRIERSLWMPAARILAVLRAGSPPIRTTVDQYLNEYCPLDELKKNTKGKDINSETIFGYSPKTRPEHANIHTYRHGYFLLIICTTYDIHLSPGLHGV